MKVQNSKEVARSIKPRWYELEYAVPSDAIGVKGIGAHQIEIRHQMHPKRIVENISQI